MSMPAFFSKPRCILILLSLLPCAALAADVEFAASGTSFAITRNGHLVTNYHVVQDLNSIVVYDQNKKAHKAEVLAVDPVNDLAILGINEKTRPLYLDATSRVRKGSDIATLGFPNIDVQGTEAKFTNGSVTAESGLGGDIRFFQVSAPIQPGNSGGPLLDSHGSVIGVITSKLSDKYMLQKGAVAQNVNYAVKVQYLLAMVSSTRGVRDDLLKAPAKNIKSREDVAELAENAVYLVYGKGQHAAAANTPPPIVVQAPPAPPPTAQAPAPVITPVRPRLPPGLVRIGHVAPLTGAIAHLGQENENAARMAIEDLNNQGISINGNVIKFELITDNDAGDPKEALLAARRLIAAGVQGVVGHLNSGTSIPASKIYFDAGIPQVAPAATNSAYSRQGYSTTFRMVADDDEAGRVMAKRMTRDLAARRIAIINSSDNYGAGVARAFRQVAEQNNATVFYAQSVSPDARNFSNEIAAIQAGKADLIFFGGMSEQAVPLLAQMARLGIYTTVVGTDGICVGDLARQTGYVIKDNQVICAEAGGVESSRVASYNAFNARYKKRFGKDVMIYAPYVYDAVMSLVKAMQMANSTEPSSYLGYMSKLQFNGVTGFISFDASGNVRDPAMTLYTYRGGNRVISGVQR